jgi:hypothetical protein
MGPCLCGDPYCPSCGNPFRCPLCGEMTILVEDRCGQCGEPIPDPVEDEPYGMSDVEADADTLRSAGMGTDEDYGYYGENDGY